MESFAKWSVVVVLAVGMLANVSTALKKDDRSDVAVGGALAVMLINLWVVIAVLVWWQP